MRLSFVIPAYNEERYLGGCLESILEQTRDLPDTEIVVVNNASTDGTRDVALSYPRVRLVDEPRKGLTYARQAGFARAADLGQLGLDLAQERDVARVAVHASADRVPQA